MLEIEWLEWARNSFAPGVINMRSGRCPSSLSTLMYGNVMDVSMVVNEYNPLKIGVALSMVVAIFNRSGRLTVPERERLFVVQLIVREP